MAKPIRATPELKGEEADRFITKMISVERSKLTKIDKELIERISLNSKYFKVY